MEKLLALAVVFAFVSFASASALKDPKEAHSITKTVDPALLQYFIWTRYNADNFDYQSIQIGNKTSLEVTLFDPSLRTYFLLHGYTDSATKLWILKAKTDLLTFENCNVFAVEYKNFVLSPNYPAAVSNMYEISAGIASFIDWLVLDYELSTARIHIIGHSLGAHTAGMTAYYVSSGKIDRVTGLDPAGPLFYDKPSDQCLDKSQANFVDVIHSNGCSILTSCQGIAKPIGHVDFYPNGGRYQEGCTAFSELVDGCSHQRATNLWNESILAGTNGTLSFKSWPCKDWHSFVDGQCQECGQGCLQMGLHVQRNLEGSYFLSTNDVSPYALGDTQQQVQ